MEVALAFMIVISFAVMGFGLLTAYTSLKETFIILGLVVVCIGAAALIGISCGTIARWYIAQGVVHGVS